MVEIPTPLFNRIRSFSCLCTCTHYHDKDYKFEIFLFLWLLLIFHVFYQVSEEAIKNRKLNCKLYQLSEAFKKLGCQAAVLNPLLPLETR